MRNNKQAKDNDNDIYECVVITDYRDHAAEMITEYNVNCLF